MKLISKVIGLFIILCFCIISCDTKQNSFNQELYIIGTMHDPSEGINADSMVIILKNLKPDVILLELDSSAFNEDFNLTTQIEGNEIFAAKEYLKANPNIKVRPIEFEGRDQYRKSQGLSPNPGETYGILGQLADDSILNNQELEIWNKFIELFSRTSKLVEGELKDLNLKSADILVDSLMYFQYIRVKEIVESQNAFDRLMLDSKGDSVTIEDHFKSWANFEYEMRNNAMAENVVRTLNSLPKEKRFVLLVGFQHRFYIKKKLESENPAIVIKEYY